MANKGHENLVPQNKRTKAEQREIAKKGGKASGKARQERKKLKDELLLLLEKDDMQEKMCLALIRQAQRGNIKAFEVIRDTVGEKPNESTPMDDREDDNLWSAISGAVKKDEV